MFIFDKRNNLIEMAKKSVGISLFSTRFVIVDGKKLDITENGALSCAFFVSSLLMINHLINNVHTTVNGLIKDLKLNNWKEVELPEPGAIIKWRSFKQIGQSKNHSHVGIYIGNNIVVSNNSAKRSPQTHHWQYNFFGDKKINISSVFFYKFWK